MGKEDKLLKRSFWVLFFPLICLGADTSSFFLSGIVTPSVFISSVDELDYRLDNRDQSFLLQFETRGNLVNDSEVYIKGPNGLVTSERISSTTLQKFRLPASTSAQGQESDQTYYIQVVAH